MPNLAALPLQALGLLAVLAFVASLIGHSLARNPFVGAILAVILFVAAYVFWNYYDHNLLPAVRFRLA
jgi:hypothetical protein